MKEKVLLTISGATLIVTVQILINIIAAFVANDVEDRKETRSVVAEQSKLLVQLQERSHYLFGEVPAAPVSTPSAELKAAAQSSK